MQMFVCFDRCKRFFSSLLMAGITVNTLAIIALSTWGIYETIDKVENAVDSSFDLVEQTENRVGCTTMNGLYDGKSCTNEL